MHKRLGERERILTLRLFDTQRLIETMEVELAHALPKILADAPRLYLQPSVGERLDVCPCRCAQCEGILPFFFVLLIALHPLSSVVQVEPISFAGEVEGLRILLELSRPVPAAFFAFTELARFTLGGTRTPLVARISQCTFTS
jgi:hypothetical protein